MPYANLHFLHSTPTALFEKKNLAVRNLETWYMVERDNPKWNPDFKRIDPKILKEMERNPEGYMLDTREKIKKARHARHQKAITEI